MTTTRFHTTDDRTGRLGRAVARLAAIVAAPLAALLLFGGTPAAADVQVAGIRFHTTIDCGTTFGVQTTNTNSDVIGYAMASVYDYSTGQWTNENSWHRVSAWSSFDVTDLPIDHPGWYYFYMRYAQWTSSGWAYGGEYITSYNQHQGFTVTRSTACWYD